MTRRALPATVWALGLVSLLMDVSSEMVHALLPLFLVGTLGASTAFVGLVEGLGEALALLVKLASGPLSDRLGRRNPLVLAGYGLSALTKPLFALAWAPAVVLAARLIDRTGKGLRGAPRDALIADVTPPDRRGSAYGLRQALDTLGAVLGPLLASAILLVPGGSIRLVFWLAALPAAAAVALILWKVREPPAPAAAPAQGAAAGGRAPLGPAFRRLLPVGLCFGLGRLSLAFLILRGADLGLPAAAAPLVLAAVSVIEAAVSWPFGRLHDRIGPRLPLALALAALAAAHAALALADGLAWLGAGLVLWGLHLGMAQGVLSAAVAEAVPPARRATAFGVFNALLGVALLAGNSGAGLLWDRAGPAAAFGFGAAAALAGLALWLAAGPRRGGRG
ncbi:MAG: MFS transporter [Alphaproteobacteria bacterium]|nr:MAG: MFS transporter [Alphaproteobacteria bacterium]